MPRSPLCCPGRRGRSGVGSARRFEARTAGRIRLELGVVRLQPLHERDVRLGVRGRDSSPRAASRCRGSTDRRPGRCRSRTRASRTPPAVFDGAGRLAPVRETCGRVEMPGSSSAPVGHASMQSVTSRSRAWSGGVTFHLHVGDERPEHDPGAEPPRDQQRVLAVEADTRAGRGLAVDVLVRVHEHAVGAAKPPTKRLRASSAAPRSRPTTCSAVAAPRPGVAQARRRSSRGRPRSPYGRPGAGARGGTTSRAAPS